MNSAYLGHYIIMLKAYGIFFLHPAHFIKGDKKPKIPLCKGFLKICNNLKTMAHAGLEPATFALLARRSNQLS